MSGRAGVLWRVSRQRGLPRLEAAFAAFALAEHGTWLAILVYAYQRGGVRQAGLIAVVQLVPAMFAAPFAAFAGDRFRPQRALAAGFAAQSATMALTAAGMSAGHPLMAYAAATLASVSITFTRPVVGALLPLVTDDPADLVAANVVVGLVQYLGMFAGPLLGAVLLAAGSPSTVFAAGAVAVLAGALLSLGLPLHAGGGQSADIDARGVVAEVLGGLRALRDHVTMRTVVLLGALGALSGGIGDVLTVLFAEARLGGGGGQAGVLAAAVGIGSMCGAAACTGLIGTTRSTAYLAAAGVLIGVPYAALSAVHAPGAALAVFALVGIGNGASAVTTQVAVQRGAPPGVLARIFGVSEGLHMAGLAAGSLLVSLAVDRFGLNGALLALAGTLLAAASVGVIRFATLGGDHPPPRELIDRLRADPIFAVLGVAALERLARGTERMHLPAGAVVCRQGQHGDSYYLVDRGEVGVDREGRMIRRIGPTGSFGEIALLHDVPRTATVTTLTDTELIVVRRSDFLEAVTGHPASLAAAHDVATRLLAR